MAFGLDFTDPQQMGMLGLAAGLLNASGPSRLPVSLGQAVGAGLQAAPQFYGNAIQNKMASMRLPMMEQAYAQLMGKPGQAQSQSPTSQDGGLSVPNNQGSYTPMPAPNQGTPQVGQSTPQMTTPQGGSPQGSMGTGGYFDPQQMYRTGMLYNMAGIPGGSEMINAALAHDPTLQAPVAVRPGGSLYDRSGKLIANAPNIGPGMQMNGDQAQLIPGYGGAAAQIADIQNRSKANYEPMEVVGPDGAKYTVSRSALMRRTPPQPKPSNPAAPAPGAQPGIQTALSPEQQKINEQVLPEQYAQAQKNYQSAQDVTGRLDMVDHAIEALNQSGWSSTGTGADTRMGAIKALNSFETSFGMKPSFDPAKVANWEDFNKESTRMGFELAKTLGSREAQTIVQQATAAVPNSKNTYMGARLVSSSVRQAAQRQADFYEYLNKRTSSGQSTMGADVEFNKTNPPSLYAKNAIVNAIPDPAKAYLMQHPETRMHFDQTFGPGTSRMVLGK